MQPYNDNPNEEEARENRRLTRLQQMEQLEAAATGRVARPPATARSGVSPQRTRSAVSPQRTVSSPHRTRSRSPTRPPGLSHRAFVARQFLEDEDDDVGDVENVVGLSTPEPGISVDESGNDGRRHTHANIHQQPATAAATGRLFAQADRFEVDQTVNLMDVDAAQYQKKGRKGSMVDIFLDSTGAHEGHHGGHGYGNYRRIGKCQEVCCGGKKKLLWLVAVGMLLVSVLVATLSPKGVAVAQIPDGAYGSRPGKEAAFEVDYSLPRLDQIKQVIIERRITSEKNLLENGTAANRAWHWLSDMDEARIPADDPGVMERYALATYFYSTQPSEQGDAQEFENWYSDNRWMSKNSVCRWYGVDCEVVDNTGFKAVVHLNHTHNQLQGTLPRELAALSYLAVLDVSSNRLTGPISPVAHIRGLKYAVMNDNLFTGNIDAVTSIVGAVEINLSNNKLKGSLPDEITQLTNLTTLIIDHNELNGKLQIKWTESNINTLHVNHNEFEGILPYAFFRMTSLVDFRAGNNLLTGTLAPEIETIQKLEVFDVHNNKLHGYLPEAFDRLHYLRELNLQFNQFTGDLPTTMGLLKYLEELFLDNNQFTGGIPQEFGGMTSLQTLVLHHNNISSSIPTTIGSMKSLREIWLNHNYLTGSIPLTLGNIVSLQHVYLENNNFRGTLPESLGQLKQLETLRVFNNSRLVGTMPQSVCSLKANGVLNFVAADCKQGLSCDCCSECY